MGTITRSFANFIGPDGKLQSGSLAAGVGGLAVQSVVVADGSTGLTAVAGRAYPIDTTSGTITVTLPATPSAGDQVQLVDYAGTFDTNALIIDPNGEDIEGATDNLQLTGEREGVILTYIDSTQGWIATSGINEGTNALSPVSYSVDFLVVAGGGSGGTGTGKGGPGGGGAGGYRNSYSTEQSGGGGSSEASLSFSVGTVYTVTVGAGASVDAANGTDSSISGTGITTITSSGGGRGGGGSILVTAGGSGGGTNGDNVPSGAGAGTANQGFDGGLGTTNQGGGGGGGSGAIGGNGASVGGGVGGVGLSSSITGSGVFRAGGGGASSGNSYSGGAGGTGGGGAGGGGNDPQPNGTAGIVNTGGGGGGSRSNGGAGGKGVVILRMLTANYSGTTTGSPTVGTDGTDTILTFNDSGSYTG